MDVWQYHERTKHRPDRYAPGPETIDWDRQPDPFRCFSGAPIVYLPLTQTQTATSEDSGFWFENLSLNDLFSVNPIGSQSVSLQSLAVLLEYSLALSAWKQYGQARWSLRCNPSSGNLHPTEAYLVLLGIEGFSDGLYHYRADLHALEWRCAFEAADDIQALDAVQGPQVFVGLSSVHWREAWKYGERALRYCYLDCGHAVAALTFAAALNGWEMQWQPWGGDQLATLLGTNRADDFVDNEREWVEGLWRINLDTPVQALEISQLVALAEQGHWQGQANTLDKRHFYDWPIIAAAAENAVFPATMQSRPGQIRREWVESVPLPGNYLDSLYRLIRLRRSAQAYDGSTAMTAEQFYTLLDHMLPRLSLAPWPALPETAAIHCVLFVHRVEGLKPGLYALPRTDSGKQLLQKELREEFLWQPVEQAPAQLPLYSLLHARAERTAANLSCQQAIAADGAFCLVMLAEFESAIKETPWRYPELFWEAGALGQILYLEAQGIGIQGTGIGCFYDDAVHSLLGLESQALQSLYHFTVGQPVVDTRLVSFPPYHTRQV